MIAAVLALLTTLANASERPMIVAHRGASKDAPENTIPAFKLAWAQDADAIEGDFRLSQDGHIVCVHDHTTKRVAGTELIVKNSTLEELRALDVGAHRGADYLGTRIPTLAEVFATVPDQKCIYIEIKCGTEIIPALLREIAASDLQNEQIVVIAFDDDLLQELKAKAPELKVLWLCSFKKKLLKPVTPSEATVLETLKRIGAAGLDAGQGHLSLGLVQRVMAEGYEVHVWTVDDPQAARRFKRWNLRSITSNVPELLKVTPRE